MRNDWPTCGDVRKAGIAETRRGLALFRSMVDAGRIVHDATADLDRQVANARVRQTANGTLTLGRFHRSDLLRAAIWALTTPTPRHRHRPSTAEQHPCNLR